MVKTLTGFLHQGGNIGWPYVPFSQDVSWPGFLYCFDSKYLEMRFENIRNRVIHRSVCTRKQSQILDILGNIEILARTRPGKMARMVTLGNMICPWQVMWNVDSKVAKAIYSLHRSPIDHRGLVAPHLFCAEVHYQLLCLADIQKEVVLLTPVLQSFNLLQISSLIIIRDQAYMSTGTCSGRAHLTSASSRM